MRAGAGVQYELNQDVTLGLAYEYLDLGGGNINLKAGNLRGDRKGDYQKNQIYFLGLNVVWKF
jgi:long-chain fatty acid transport protein